MFDVTKPDGKKLKVDGTRVIRARRAIWPETKNGVQTRIDWAFLSLVKEPLDEVAALIKNEQPSFTSLTTREGSKIWFNAKDAVGPLPLVPSQMAEGVNSAFKIMGYRQYVQEQPSKVASTIKKAGGTPLPIQEDSEIA